MIDVLLYYQIIFVYNMSLRNRNNKYNGKNHNFDHWDDDDNLWSPVEKIDEDDNSKEMWVSQEFANKVCGTEISFDALKALQNSNKIGFPENIYAYLLSMKPHEKYNKLMEIYKLQLRCINKDIGILNIDFLRPIFRFVELKYMKDQVLEKDTIIKHPQFDHLFVDFTDSFLYLDFKFTLEEAKKYFNTCFKFFNRNNLVLIRDLQSEIYIGFKLLDNILEEQPLAPIIQDQDFKTLWYIPLNVSSKVITEIKQIG